MKQVSIGLKPPIFAGIENPMLAIDIIVHNIINFQTLLPATNISCVFKINNY